MLDPRSAGRCPGAAYLLEHAGHLFDRIHGVGGLMNEVERTNLARVEPGRLGSVGSVGPGGHDTKGERLSANEDSHSDSLAILQELVEHKASPVLLALVETACDGVWDAADHEVAELGPHRDSEAMVRVLSLGPKGEARPGSERRVLGRLKVMMDAGDRRPEDVPLEEPLPLEREDVSVPVGELAATHIELEPHGSFFGRPGGDLEGALRSQGPPH